MALTTKAGPMGPQLYKVFSIAGLTQGAGPQSSVLQLSRFTRWVVWLRGTNDAGMTTLTLTLYDVVVEDAASPPVNGDKVAHGSSLTFTGVGLARAEFGAPKGNILSQKVEFNLAASGGMHIDAEVWVELFP